MAAESRDIRGIALPDSRFGHADAAGRRVRVATLLCWSIGLFLLAWNTWDQIRTATERERILGRQLAASAVEEVTRRLQETESRLKGFVNQELELLSPDLVQAQFPPLHFHIVQRLLEKVSPYPHLFHRMCIVAQP